MLKEHCDNCDTVIGSANGSAIWPNQLPATHPLRNVSATLAFRQIAPAGGRVEMALCWACIKTYISGVDWNK